MNIISILELFGGVGLFLFGMSLMGSSLEKIAGSKLEKIMETLTTSKKKGVGALKGWGLGLGVTGIIQSSAATTLMLIGFVNAGIIKLVQAIPVVYGANIGSTVTAQILRLGDLSSENIVLKLLKPSSFAPMLLTVGAFLHLFSKKQQKKHLAGILVGLGTLFYGMTIMEEVFAPLKDSEKFQRLFTSFSNPFIGILIGLVLTAIIQSSSASVGILQALSATGGITYSIAIPIIIGQNLGKCTPIILGAIGANKKAKRVSITYVVFNIIGAILFCLVIYTANMIFGLPFMEKVVNRGNIANFHFLFNFATSVVLLPFNKQMLQLTGKMVKDTDAVPGDEEIKALDDMLLKTPGIALNQCIRLINKMSEKILENFQMATGMIKEYAPNNFVLLEENESFIDRCETALSDYIVKIDRKRLTPDNKLVVSEVLSSIGDFERMGDYSMNIAYVAQEMNENKIAFSKKGQKELEAIMSATQLTVETVMESFSTDNLNMAIRVEPMAHTVKELNELIKSHHVDRLQDGDCGVEGGVALYDLMNSFERISSHCANVALHVVKRIRGEKDFDDMHGHVDDTTTEEYKALESYYEMKYIDPIRKKTKKKS